MTRDEALELIERLPFIRTFTAPNDKTLESLFRDALATDDCVEWIRVFKTCYVRRHDKAAKRPLPPTAAALGDEAHERFASAVGAALSLSGDELDTFIHRHLEESW